MTAGVVELDDAGVEVTDLAVDDVWLLEDDTPGKVDFICPVVFVDAFEELVDAVVEGFEAELVLAVVEAGGEEVVVINVEVLGVVGPHSPQYF